MPYDDVVVVTAECMETLLQLGNNNLDIDVPKTLDAWTGNVGFVAVGLLCKVAAARGAAVSLTPPRTAVADRVMVVWVRLLPTPNKPRHHLRGWTEDEQEMLQFSLTKKIND